METLFETLFWIIIIFCAFKVGSIFDQKFDNLEQKIDNLGHKIDSIIDGLNRFDR